MIYIVMEVQADWRWNGDCSVEEDRHVPIRAFLTNAEAEAYLVRYDSSHMYVSEVPLGDE